MDIAYTAKELGLLHLTNGRRLVGVAGSRGMSIRINCPDKGTDKNAGEYAERQEQQHRERTFTEGDRTVTQSKVVRMNEMKPNRRQPQAHT